MNAKNFNAQSVSELESKLDRLLESDFKPTFALVFCSVAHNIDEIRSVYKKKEIALIGCSSAGEFVDDEIFRENIVTMLFDMDDSFFRIELIEGVQTKFIAKKTARKALSYFTEPAIVVFSSGLAVNGDNVVDGIQEVAELPLFGGLAGDDLKTEATYVFTENQKSDNALVSLILDTTKVLVVGAATSGWKAIGTPKKITKSEGNILYTIDNQPALDIFLKYFKIDNLHNKKDVITEIGVKYPLQVQRKGYKTLRAPLMANDDGSLVLAGAVDEGEEVYLSMPPDFDVIDQSIDEIATLRNEFSDADAVIVVSCAARHLALGPLIETELNGLYEIWNAPLLGFFSYAEIGTMSKAETCDMHNETISLFFFKER